ncbi:MAG: DUF4031 domain-containing protein [Gemmatimonadetes bacterium]|nr:DUF4031 domain-containing protein [Gemmatimonadota bacterium]
MIKYHFHLAPRDVPPLGIYKGDRLCHVYSDTSIVELYEWGREHGLKRAWVDRKHVLPHYDVRADLVSEHEPGVGRAELVADIRAWRARERESRAGSY